MAAKARRRVLAEHSAERRAEELVSILTGERQTARETPSAKPSASGREA